MNNIYIVLDLNNKVPNYIPPFNPTVGDSNLCVLNFTLVNNGAIFDLTGLTAKISLGKPDGTSTFANMNISNATVGAANYTLQTSDIAVAGQIIAEIVLYDSSNGRLTSVAFNFNVKQGVLNESSVESSNNFSALTSALSTVTEIDNKADKTYVDSNLAIVNASLAESMIHFKYFSPVGDGIADDTTKFINANNSVITNNSKLLLEYGKTYKINLSSDINLMSIEGNNATLSVSGTGVLRIDNNSKINNLNIIDNTEYLNDSMNYTALFKEKIAGIQNIEFNNVTFTGNTSVADGTKRTRPCIDITGGNIKINNVKGYNVMRGISINGLYKNLFINNISFENCLIPTSVAGCDPFNTDTTLHFQNVNINGVRHINTQTQAGNYDSNYGIYGEDTLLLERCKNVDISNVYVEFACERVIYASSCSYCSFHDFIIFNSEGLKFVGKQNTAQSINYIADTCNIYNISSVFSVLQNGTTPFNCSFVTYFSKNVYYDNCKTIGGTNALNFIWVQFNVSNIRITNCYADGLCRSFALIQNMSDITGGTNSNPEVTTIYEANYTHQFNNIRIIDNKCANIGTWSASFIKFDDTGTTLTTGNYRWIDITIKGNKINNADSIRGNATTTTQCSGLFSLNDIDGLIVEDNDIRGYIPMHDSNANNIQVPFQVNSNSKNIVIKHTENTNTIYSTNDITPKFYLGTLYCSPGSEIKINIFDRLDNRTDYCIITPNVNSSDITPSVNLMNSFTMKGELNFRSSGNDSIMLYGFNNTTYVWNNILGYVDVYSDSGDYAKYLVNKNTTIKILGTSNTDVALSSGKISLYKDGTNNHLKLRDYLNISNKVKCVYSFSSYNAA